jgi:hypothetical protein
MDPLTLTLLGGGVGGAGGKFVEKLWDAVGSRWFRSATASQTHAAASASQQYTFNFLSRLALKIGDTDARLARLNESIESRVRTVLADPDVLAALRQAIENSTRMESATKQDVLAQAVAERLRAPTDSTEAVAANWAIDILPRLSNRNLDVLGLLALIYVLRPAGLPLADSPEPGVSDYDVSNKERELLHRYPAWIRSAVSQYPLSDTLNNADIAHLVSTACVVLDRGVHRKLEAVLSPFGRRELSMAAAAGIPIALGEFTHFDESGRALAALWQQGLQEISPTPAGLLIGAAVHSIRAGATHVVDWSSALATDRAPQLDLEIWDGRRIRNEFLDVLDKEVRDRAERGVRPWSDFGPH